MRAELVMIGTELLLGQVVDTNATYLAQRLAEIGVDVRRKTVVGDDWLSLVAALSEAVGRADVVITSGGLGPTADDLTREAVAAVLGVPLELDPEALAHVRGFFARLGRPMPENNRKQAMMPRGARPLPNPRGTAPGFIAEQGGKAIICLPGVPVELEGMWEQAVRPYLRQRQARVGERVIYSRWLRFHGIGESALEERVRDLIGSQTNPTVALYAGVGEVRLRLTARAADEAAAQALVAPLEAAIRARVREYLYGEDDDTLESVVGRLLAESGWTVAVAESCTGGLLAQRLTSVPGSSRYFLGGWVTYSDEAKERWLGVPADLLAAHGAVSEPVARAMAEGARARAGADFAAAITGIAGPSGGSAEKPVGLVYVAVAGPQGTQVERHLFPGSREQVRQHSALAALAALRQAILSARGSRSA